MSDLPTVMEALRKADQQGNTDDARRLAQIAERLSKGPQAEEQPAATSFVPSGVARGLGAPVDLVNAVLNVAGLGSDDPVLGSRHIERGLRGWYDLFGTPAAIAPKGAQPKTLPARMMRGVGEAGGALPLFGLSANALAARGTGALSEAGRTAVQTMARSPGTSLAAETTMGATSGAGGYVANKLAPGNETAEFFGEVLGGISPAAVATAGRVVPGAQMAARGLRAATVPFTKAGASDRAAARVQSLTADPERAASRIAADTPGNLSPAEKSGEPGLLSLEREVASTSPARFEAQQRRQAEALQSVEDALNELGQGGSPLDARDFVSGRRDRFIQDVQRRARQAATDARAQLDALTPEQRASESSRIVKEQIDKAYGDISAQESRLWGRVPKEAEVPTTASREAYERLVSELPQAQREDIPDIARRLLDPDAGNSRFGETETVNEVWGLRSKLLEEGRTARANGQNNKARIADELADALLTDLGARTDDIQGEVGEALRAALDFTRAKKQAFDQGAVGRLREVRKTGEPRIPEDAALAATVGRGGERGGRAVEQIAGVTGDMAPIRNYALERFLRVSTSGDKFNPRAAANWIADNRDVIDRIPGLADDLAGARTAQDVAEVAARQAKRAGASLSDQHRSYTALYLNADPYQQISALAKARNPSRAAREVVVQARKDPTGRALRGVKAALANHLIESNGLGRKGLTELLNDRGLGAVVRQVLSPDEVDYLRRVALSMDRLRAGNGPLPNVGGVINDTPSAILSTLARVLAAQQGRAVATRMGGGTVQTPGIFSNRAQQVLERLTRDKARELLIQSINDPDKMVALLLRGNIKNRRDAQRLNAWLEGPVARLVEGEDEQR